MKSINTNFTTIKAVTDDLIKNLSEEDKNSIQSTKESELLKFHFGLGTMIRNQNELWKDNQQLLNDCGVTEPDDASSIIIKKLWQKLRS